MSAVVRGSGPTLHQAQGHRAIQLQCTVAAGCLDEYTTLWCDAITDVLSGAVAKDSHGVGCFRVMVRPEKRLELVRALLKSRMVEVSSSIQNLSKCKAWYSLQKS